jgi:hypothetical protein
MNGLVRHPSPLAAYGGVEAGQDSQRERIMGFFEKAKEQASHLKDSEKVREVAEKVKGKVEDVQTKRKVSDLLEDLGRLLYAQKTERVNPRADAEIDRIVAELHKLEDDGVTILPEP